MISNRTRHDPRWSDLERLRRTTRMYDAVIDEQHGRRIRVGDQWLADFASCNYLGLDLDEEVMASIAPLVALWGTHPSWSRLLGNPRPYIEIEERLTDLLAAPDTLVLPTISLIHTAVIPALVGHGWVFVDARAHKTIWDGCIFAQGHGATVRRVHVDDVEALAKALAEAPPGARRLVCLDGVNSMTGNLPDLASILKVCREHDAIAYVDDAHGFGVIGERPNDAQPYGHKGNSIVRHLDQGYDNLILVGGFSKSYSSLLAFLALPTELKNYLKVAAPPYLYSGPSPTASLATVLAGMTVNAQRGDQLRADLHRKTTRVLDHVHALGLHTPNTSGLPIIELPLDNPDDIDAIAEFLFTQGIYVTIAAYPLVPRSEVGFRIQVTTSNTDEEIDELNATLTLLSERYPMKTARSLTPLAS